jgi:hypothetical protein
MYVNREGTISQLFLAEFYYSRNTSEITTPHPSMVLGFLFFAPPTLTNASINGGWNYQFCMCIVCWMKLMM